MEEQANSFKEKWTFAKLIFLQWNNWKYNFLKILHNKIPLENFILEVTAQNSYWLTLQKLKTDSYANENGCL